MKKIHVSIDEIRQLCEPALTNRGASAEEAATVVQDYIDADLNGRESHGLSSFSVALGQFPKRGEFEIVDRGRAHITIDGHGDCGHTVGRKGVDLGATVVEESGICVIGIRHVTRFACPGAIARYATDKGLVSIVLEYGGQNFMAPPGGKSPSLSTNPIGIGIPVAEGSTFILDIATSSRAIGFVGLAKLAGETIPGNWAISDQGIATTDPNAVNAMIPFGGYKGYGLALAFEILSGVLVGVPVGKQGNLSDRGALVLLIKPDIFGIETALFARNVSQFLDEVLSTPAIDGQVISYPGLRSHQRRDEMLARNVIELPEEVVTQLRMICGERSST